MQKKKLLTHFFYTFIKYVAYCQQNRNYNFYPLPVFGNTCFMTKKWTVTQNVIATLLQAWALFFVYSFTNSVFSRMGNAVNEGIVGQQQISYIKMFTSYNAYYLSGILVGIGGLGLLYDKKWGWITSLATSLAFMMFMLSATRTAITDHDNGKTGGNITSHFIEAIAFAAIAVLLTLKPFRTKYQPSLLNWLAIAGILSFLLADKHLFGQ